MITTRLVVVSLLVGVVLAVASVPVAKVVFDQCLQNSDGSPNIWWLEQDEHKALIYRSAHGPGARWWVCSGPSDSSLVRSLGEVDSGAEVIRTDPRPRAIRWPLDMGEREARYDAVGWPLHSASRGRIWAETPDASDAWGPGKVTLLGHEMSLPTRPIWPGLLGNTLFYAAVVLTPLALLRWRTLRRRARRGLCLACGYEFGVGVGEGIGACPECGLEKSAS